MYIPFHKRDISPSFSTPTNRRHRAGGNPALCYDNPPRGTRNRVETDIFRIYP
ncbi:hypothetical protein NIES39_O02910 [Arthrospira platensis NIES-39]|nr:hypothetical protein NIES39_O02910 [Arthrospira platensis NIES-39]